MTIIRLIFAAALASFAVANVDEVSNDGETFAEATAFVQSFSSMNAQGDSACLKVADDAIKVITDECKTLQGVIDTASKANQKCCHSGSVATCEAKSQHASSVGAHSTCLSQLDTIKKKTVNLGSVSYSSLAGKTCYNHNSNSAFQAIKNEVATKTTECNKKSGSKAAAKKFYDDAVKAAASSRTTCNEDGQTALTKAFAQGKAACGSATNQKAFTRAEHMKCVLKGTKLADCSKNMPKPPAVKETTLSTLNCAAQTGDSTQCLKVWVTYKSLSTSGYKVNMYRVNVPGPTKAPGAFVKACGAYGLKPVCDSNGYGKDSGGQCRAIDPSDNRGLHFSLPAHSRLHPKSKATGIFWFTGNKESLYNNGNSHRWANGNDKNGYTMCA
jgi:hypothetical protein